MSARIRAVVLVAAGAAGVIAAILGFARLAGRRAELPPGFPSPAAPRPASGGPQTPSDPGLPSNADLVAQKYNAVLQVRANDAKGEAAAVGTPLPRRLTLELEDAEGRRYAEQFDRVGLWAIEVPVGTYAIAATQTGLGEWRWKLTGAGVAKTAHGWTVTFKAGTMNPMVDLLLFP